MRYLALFLALALLSPLAASAATTPIKKPAPPVHYDRLFYYREGPLARKSFFAHPGSIDIFAPQVYALAEDGSLSGTLKQDLIDFAKSKKIRVMPVVTNGSFSQDSYQGLLGDPAKEESAIQALILEAKDRGYIGWQLDFEQLNVGSKDEYSAFVAKAAEEMHGAGLKLSVAVVSKVSDTPSDYKGNLWVNLIGAYDYDALGKSADFISLMSYDDPESKGPIVEWPWLMRVLTYTQAHIPANKISLGIPLYYWQWNDLTGKLVGIGDSEGIQNVFKYHPGTTIFYDPTYRAPSIYFVKNGVPYTLWYENARSVAEKVQLVRSRKFAGVSLWALGQEVSGVYTALKQ